MGKYRRHFTIVAVLVALGTVFMDWLLRTVLYLPPEASTQARIVDGLLRIHIALIAFFFSLIVVFVAYSVIVFRARSGEEGDGDFIHGHTTLEIVWTAVPLAIVIVLGFIGARTLNEMTAPQPNEMVIQVIGRQWSWSFTYPDTGITSTEMVVPVDQPVLLKMESPDVIHSFYVPEFRVKQDLVPGRVTEVRFTPTQTGVFLVRCAELCGTAHADMRAPVRVVTPEEYQAWVQEQTAQPADDPVALGQKVAETQGCLACHSIDGTRLVGPTWQGLFGKEEALEDGRTVTVDEEYLYRAIVDPDAEIVAGFPPGVMPQNYGELLSDQEIQALIEYIKSLQ